MRSSTATPAHPASPLLLAHQIVQTRPGHVLGSASDLLERLFLDFQRVVAKPVMAAAQFAEARRRFDGLLASRTAFSRGIVAALMALNADRILSGKQSLLSELSRKGLGAGADGVTVTPAIHRAIGPRSEMLLHHTVRSHAAAAMLGAQLLAGLAHENATGADRPVPLPLIRTSIDAETSLIICLTACDGSLRVRSPRVLIAMIDLAYDLSLHRYEELRRLVADLGRAGHLPAPMQSDVPNPIGEITDASVEFWAGAVAEPVLDG